ncbi:MAG: hypothetical protein KDN19_15245 [Verrucomicrobiae bacterium]|nr:hypothetical protein [Verrucomicrobiae bacterium]
MSSNLNTNYPAFVIGITGNMDLDFSEPKSEETLRERLRVLLLFLRYGYDHRDPRLDHKESPRLGDLIATLTPCSDSMLKGLEDWAGVGEKTELVLLSSLAPGADTLAVEVFQELCDDPTLKNFHGRVCAPLPFPPSIYREATTFVRDGESDAENQARQEDFDRLLGQLDGDKIFEVLISDDVVAKTGQEEPESSHQRWEQERSNKVQRRRRYQAAGEYVATYSDLLIAIYDDRHISGSSAGSNAIVEAKRQGATPDLLPMTQAFTWADNGPVFHLFHPRIKQIQSKTDDNEATATETNQPRSDKPLRILHPYELGPEDDETRSALSYRWTAPDIYEKTKSEKVATPYRLLRAFEKWQERGNQLISRIAYNLGKFNEDLPVDRESTALYEMLGFSTKGRSGPALEAALKARLSAGLCGEDVRAINEGMNFLNRLWPISQVRRRASDISGKLHATSESILKGLFLLSFLSAVLLHFFSHWHPLIHDPDYQGWVAESQGKEQGAAHADPSDQKEMSHECEPSNAHGANGESSDCLEVLRPLWGLFGLSIVCLGLTIFFGHLVSGREEKDHDRRALAEGLRVQFYWCLAGLRRSVAGNYMQRTRTEMDWVRNAISSLSFPLEHWQRDFLNLHQKIQCHLLRLATENWVGPPIPNANAEPPGKGHPSQFHYYRRNHHDKSRELHIKHALGRAIAMAGFLHLPFLIGFATEKESTFEWRSEPWIWFFLLAGSGLLLHCHTAIQYFSNRELPTRFGLPLQFKNFDEFFGCVFPHHSHARTEIDPCKRKLAAVRNFGQLIPPALSVTLVSVSVCLMVSRISENLPGPFDFMIVGMGACLVGGALLIAYAEKRLLSEHAYQYGAAASLFASARLRLERNLSAMEKAVEKGDQDAFHEAREKIQDLLLALGKEALDENSEWLILHRARPMEPVIGG